MPRLRRFISNSLYSLEFRSSKQATDFSAVAFPAIPARRLFDEARANRLLDGSGHYPPDERLLLIDA